MGAVVKGGMPSGMQDDINKRTCPEKARTRPALHGLHAGYLTTAAVLDGSTYSHKNPCSLRASGDLCLGT